MVDCQILHDAAFVLHIVFEGPDAVVSDDGEIGKVDEGFGAQGVPKDDIALVLEVVAFVFLLIGVDDGVDVVES